MSNFGEWLKSERGERRWSQDDLSDRADMTKPTISRFETGFRDPSRDMVERIATALAGDDAEEEEVRRLVNAGLRAAGFLPDDEPAWDDLTMEAVEAFEGIADKRAAIRLLRAMRDPEDDSVVEVTDEMGDDDLSAGSGGKVNAVRGIRSQGKKAGGK